MITIKSINKDGVLSPAKPLPISEFGRKFDGENWLIFESQEEADANIKKIEIGKPVGAAVAAILSASPEEIEQIKLLLK